MLVQYILVAIVLVLASGYAFWRIRRVVKHKGNPCEGCAGCALKDIRQKEDCHDYRNYRKR